MRALVVALLFAVGITVGGAIGCSLVAGVDFGSAHEAPAGAGAGDDDGGVADVPDAAPTGCATDQKSCNGGCVSASDPNYGCGSKDCLPCSIAFAKGATCKNGKCAPNDCNAGHDDCDGDPTNGCEADLARPATCGSCAVQCPQSAALCAPTGCVSTCPPGTQQCGSSCVDVSTSITNCGQCDKACVSPTNGDPACINSTCAFACHAGFGDCQNNPARACDPLPKWYADGDGDGVGGAASVSSCTPPTGYAAKSGDCLDTNGQVFPGQAAFFGVPFTDAAGAQSYDYDCSGVEVEDFPEHWPGSCGVACDGAGYSPKVGRSGAGVDSYCGSTVYRECIDNGGLNPASLHPAVGVGCRAQLSSLPAVTCH